MSEMYGAYLRRTKGPDAEREYWERAELDEVIAQLEAENAALWAFVDAADRRDAWDMDGARIALRQYEAERQRLATDYGIPLPGQEGER